VVDDLFLGVKMQLERVAANRFECSNFLEKLFCALKLALEKKRAILVDFDGVLGNFRRRMYDLLMDELDEFERMSYEEFLQHCEKGYDVFSCFDDRPGWREIMKRVWRQKDFTRKMPAMEGAVEGMTWLTENFSSVVIVTACADGQPLAADEKRQWLQERGLGHLPLVVTKHKNLVQGCVLLDDNEIYGQSRFQPEQSWEFVLFDETARKGPNWTSILKGAQSKFPNTVSSLRNLIFYDLTCDEENGLKSLLHFIPIDKAENIDGYPGRKKYHRKGDGANNVSTMERYPDDPEKVYEEIPEVELPIPEGLRNFLEHPPSYSWTEMSRNVDGTQRVMFYTHEFVCVLSPTPYMAQIHLLVWSRHAQDVWCMKSRKNIVNKMQNTTQRYLEIVAEKYPEHREFLTRKVECGFHKPPSVHRLHMHVLIGNLTDCGLHRSNVRRWIDASKVELC